MKKIIYLEKPIIPTLNKVLVKVVDTYDIKQRNSGVLMSNAAHDLAEADSDGYILSNFIIRKGIVSKMPRVLTDVYDWGHIPGEVKEGDLVYWPIPRFFDYPVIKTTNGELYLVVDYFDIYIKVVNNNVIPVNGFILFTPDIVSNGFREYEKKEKSGWFIIEKMGLDVVFKDNKYNFESPWDIGDKCLLSVPPFSLESGVDEFFDKDYYLAQKRHIKMAL